jgi:hypothetical protein
MTTQPPITTPAEPIETFEQKLFRWYKMALQLSALKDDEMALRKELFGHYFPDAKEGVNTEPLNPDWVVKGERKINRKILKDELSKQAASLTEAGIPLDELINYTPELSISAYRALPKEKRVLFDTILEIKDGSPTLSVVKPKRK